ncbi:hypothetical protein Hanom_Chr10g00901131 [Helianthus anomalus]
MSATLTCLFLNLSLLRARQRHQQTTLTIPQKTSLALLFKPTWLWTSRTSLTDVMITGAILHHLETASQT